jgi:hypothetical protein
MDQHEGELQRYGVLASAYAWALGPRQEVGRFAAALREVTEHWQRDTGMPARLAASGRHA